MITAWLVLLLATVDAVILATMLESRALLWGSVGAGVAWALVSVGFVGAALLQGRSGGPAGRATALAAVLSEAINLGMFAPLVGYAVLLAAMCLAAT